MDAIAKNIKDSKDIIITAHSSEDADALGSLFALGTAIKSMGKNVTVYLSEEPEDRLKFLDYDYIIFEEGMTKEHDLFIALDSADAKRLGKRSVFLEGCKSISIDHHYSHIDYATINYLEPDASSTGELIYLLIKKLGVDVTKEIAEFLYISISGDTGSFKYSSTSPRTMRIVADLMEKGIDHAELSRRLHETEKIENVLLNGYVMSNIESYFDGKLRMVLLDEETFSKFNVSERNSGDVVNIPRMVEGTEIAVSVRKTPDKIKLSFRSNGTYNVSEIAKNFGGGGHAMAAGAAVFDKTIDEIKQAIIKACGEYIND